MVGKYLSMAFETLRRCASGTHGHAVERDIDRLYPVDENEPQQIFEIGSDFKGYVKCPVFFIYGFLAV